MKHLILDCDDVMLDWLGGFTRFLNHKGIYPASPGPASWDMSAWIGQSCMNLITEFNASESFGKLEARPDAAEVLPICIDRFRVTVLTSCSTDDAIVRRRHENLHSEFFNLVDDIICLPLGASKAEMLCRLEPGIYVEDNVLHARSGVAAGHETYVMRRSHNVMLENGSLNWIDTFHDLKARFTCESLTRG